MSTARKSASETSNQIMVIATRCLKTFTTSTLRLSSFVQSVKQNVLFSIAITADTA